MFHTGALCKTYSLVHLVDRRYLYICWRISKGNPRNRHVPLVSDISSMRSIGRCELDADVRGLRICEDEEAIDVESEQMN